MECCICQKSISKDMILFLLCIRSYDLYKDIRKLLCSYLYVKCASSNNCLICIDCKTESFQSHPKICDNCMDHCCELCYETEEGYSKFICKRCGKGVCINCVGICWCQCLDCICKECTLDKDIPVCKKCYNKLKIPVCEDEDLFCDCNPKIDYLIDHYEHN